GGHPCGIVAPGAGEAVRPDDGEEGGAERDQEVSAGPGSPVTQLTVEPDRGAERRGDHQAQEYVPPAEAHGARPGATAGTVSSVIAATFSRSIAFATAGRRVTGGNGLPRGNTRGS